MTGLSTRDFYPSPSVEELRKAFVGKQLHDVPLPAAVVDRAIVRRNCAQMLEACAALGVPFRPHVKTHKTIEVTQLQVGESSQNIHVVVSTIAEAEMLVDYLLERFEQVQSVNVRNMLLWDNVLYGIPISPSMVKRLVALGKRLPRGSVSVMVDHRDQLPYLKAFEEMTGYPVRIFVKIDAGYGRAGVVNESSEFFRVVSTIMHDQSLGGAWLVGLYSHSGHSYSCDSASQAIDLLCEEIEVLRRASSTIKNRHSEIAHQQMILSVGATPSVSSIQNFGRAEDGTGLLGPRQAQAFRQSVHDVKVNHDVLELHAGVYSFLDMQQLATQASPSARKNSSISSLSTKDIAFTILTEVGSVYAERQSSEALIAAGTFALGREPCKSYSGWGIVSTWGTSSACANEHSGWQVGRISQEHGILNHEIGFQGDIVELTVGQRLKIFPNHACVAGAAFGWYLIVDSNLPEDRRDEIVDVWLRCRGW
ncbi:MAG: hypothetical protein Q9183_003026 [Haloplaca sp. 2 TL-2023]